MLSENSGPFTIPPVNRIRDPAIKKLKNGLRAASEVKLSGLILSAAIVR